MWTRLSIVYNSDLVSLQSHTWMTIEWNKFQTSQKKTRRSTNNEGIKSINDFINLFFFSRSSLMILSGAAVAEFSSCVEE